MNKKIFDAIYAYLDRNNGFTSYDIKGYYGFAYLTIGYADGPKTIEFYLPYDSETVMQVEIPSAQ
jgi:hypothetical protein